MTTTINGTTGITFPDGTTDNRAGEIFDWGGSTPPSYAVACDGTSYLRATYPALFAAIGVLWGSADGTHFNVPNFAAGEASVQNNGTVGASTVGQVINHVHQQTVKTATQLDNNSVGGTSPLNGTENTGNPTTGGSKNLAAGQYVLKCIRIR